MMAIGRRAIRRDPTPGERARARWFTDCAAQEVTGGAVAQIHRTPAAGDRLAFPGNT
ncbi:hypothetical protein [Streptomyces sp. NPDC101150]|uniref:hypothetical protein n=1 Tax=Streptomyces sp. NPDC101150 TaxID=3366114 RepID=UPI00381FA971